MGRGDCHFADQMAVGAMRQALESAPIAGTVVIVEGGRDEASMLVVAREFGERRSAPLRISV